MDPVVFGLDHERFWGSPESPELAPDLAFDVVEKPSLLEHLSRVFPGKLHLMGVEQRFTLRSAFAAILEERKVGFRAKQALQSDWNAGLEAHVDAHLPEAGDERADLIRRIVQNSEPLACFFDEHPVMAELLATIGAVDKLVAHNTAILYSEEEISERVELAGNHVLPVAAPGCFDARESEMPILRFDLVDFGFLKRLGTRMSASDLDGVDMETRDVYALLNHHRDLLANRTFHMHGLKDLWAISPGFEFRSIEDIAIAMAITRPICVSTYTFSFPCEVVPERFRECVEDTNGHLVFQEQAMAIARKFGVDPVRFRKCLFEGTDDVGGVEDIVSESELKYLRRYMPTTFLKSHAIAYAHYTYLDLYTRLAEFRGAL